MNQISANQMEALANSEKMHNERLMRQDQISRMGMLSLNKRATSLKVARMASVKHIVTLKQGNKENQLCNEDEKIKQKDADSMNKVKSLDKAVVAPPRSKFMKVAKVAALISQIKQGRDICTCSSLDASCRVHDS